MIEIGKCHCGAPAILIAEPRGWRVDCFKCESTFRAGELHHGHQAARDKWKEHTKKQHGGNNA